MRTASPWWASLIFGVGLLLFWLGDRFFSAMSGVRFVLTGLGLLLVVGIAALRLWTVQSSTGARRRVEGVMLKCHIATLVALVVYLFSTDWATAKLGLADTTAAHVSGALTVVFLALLIASLVPLLMAELSLGVAMRSRIDIHPGVGDDSGVEYLRVRELGWSGLSLGLAMSFLMVTCHVANERNVQRDVSYFKTSAPGESTQKIVASASEPMKVLLFFPDVNDVKTQVKGYFDSLAEQTGRFTVEVHDRLTDAELAGKYKVTKDGAIVLARGTGDKEKTETIDVDTDISRARSSSSKLRNLDREVNTQLLKLMHDKRKAYLLTGHGELNDPDTVPAELKARATDTPITLFKPRLTALNYEVKNLGPVDLTKDVPEDATMVIALAPTVPLQQTEWETLVRYLDRGGHVMIVLDPGGATGLGLLEAKFGLKMAPGHLTDETIVLRRHGTLSDRRNTATNQFTAHASTTALSHIGVEHGIPLLDSGALEDLPIAGDPAQAPKKTFTIRSMDSSFMDLNGNFAFDDKGPTPEKKQHWPIAAALEGPKLGDKDGYRALVFADAGLFTDLYARSPLGQVVAVLASDPLLDDSIHWLGGEELVSGDVVSEDDKPIQHTKNEEAVWFTLTLIGVPLVVLTVGLLLTLWLFGTSSRLRRSTGKIEVKQ